MGSLARSASRSFVSTSLPALFAALLLLVTTGCGTKPDGAGGAGAVPTTDPVAAVAVATTGLEGAALAARGEYLVLVGGCHDCHTPWTMGPNGPHPDMSRPLSGHPEDVVIVDVPAAQGGPWLWSGSATNTAFAGPWGVSFASNLTPSPEGMGVVDEEMFVQALRTGKHWGVGRPILPPMPWPNMAQMTEEDLRALYAYLRTVPPSPNRVPEPILLPPPTAVPAT